MTCGHIAGFSKRVTSGYLADLYPARFSVGGLWSGPYLIHGDHGHGCSLSWWVGVLDVLQQQAGVGAAAAATAFIQPQPLDHQNGGSSSAGAGAAAAGLMVP